MLQLWCDTFLRSVSVCLSVCRLSHSCTLSLLKPFDGFRCHLWGPMMEVHGLNYLGSNPQRKYAIADYSQTISPMLPRDLANTHHELVDLPQRFRLLPNYLRPCLCYCNTRRHNTHSNSNTVFINECDKRTNSKERNKERNRSNGKLKKFK